ncbi:MAG: GNAT family N-acetyltransferase [Phaeodactylibacter sp.]|nr:GNAT family N-acetyltransferase [Phaeodactylibacter sp.]
MKFTEVRSKKEWNDFHKVPHLIYKDDANWIAPLQGDVESVFNPSINDTFKDGEAVCWVLRDGNGQMVGRIAAFIDHARNKIQVHPIGGLGFFECINNETYAFALFQKAQEWLEERGATVLDGPVNFGERDKYWGLLVKGFYPPLFQENYQPRYYRNFFENWGFIPFEQILSFKGESKNIPVERLGNVVTRLKQRNQIETKPLDYSNLEKYTEDFCEIYNAAFSKYGHFKPLKPEQVQKILLEAKAIADTNTLAITYFDGKPAAFCAVLPDINELLRFAKGKLSWWKIPVLLWKKATKKQFFAKGIGFGIHPDYQQKGAYAVIIAHLANKRNVQRYPVMYLTTVRAHNFEAVGVYKKLNVEVDRIHVAYRKALKEGVPVEPFEFTEPY